MISQTQLTSFKNLFLIILLSLISLSATANQASDNWHLQLGLEKTHQYSSLFSSPFNIYQNNNSDAPGLIMIHGVAGSAQDFAPLLPNFSDYNIVLVDLPGFKVAHRNGDLYSPQNYAHALANILPQYIKGDTTLIGHSMGGNISIQLLDKAPQIASRLVLIDAAGILHKFSYSKFVAQNQVDKIPFLNRKQQKKITSVIDSINSMAPEILSDVLLSKPGRQTVLQNNTNIISALSVMEQNIGQEIRELALPTLIIWGKNDIVMPFQTGKVLDYLIPESQLIILPGVGHSPQKEAPELTANNIHYFLSQQHFSAPQEDKLTTKSLEWDCYEQGNIALPPNHEYTNLVIKNCMSGELSQVYAAHLTVTNSALSISELTINNSDNFALRLENSEIEIWGATIRSGKGMQLNHSKLDINGGNITIVDSNDAFVADRTSVILASVTDVRTKASSESWHGFVLKN